MQNNIILVDDDESIAEGIKHFLEKNNYSVSVFENGQKAFSEIIRREGTEQFNFLITDFLMPQMNGLELVKKLKENCICIPTVVISSKRRADLLVSFKDLEVLEIFEKPFELKILSNFISEILSKDREACTCKS